ELARDDAQVGDRARRRDRELQDDLALQARLVAQRAVVDRVDRALVALEDETHVLDRARCLAAVALGRRPAGATATAAPAQAGTGATAAAAARAAAAAVTDLAFDHRRCATSEGASPGGGAVA